MLPPKKPQRKYLAGSSFNPGEPVAVAEPEPLAPPAPKRRGRPPKGDRSMTAAERKQRERTKDERHTLVDDIKRRIKTSEHANISAMRRALAKFHDTLDLKSLEDLKQIAASYKIHDRTGRKFWEGHTGTVKTNEGFVDRLTLIDAAHQRDEETGGRKPRVGSTAGTHEWNTKFSPLRMWDNVKTIWNELPGMTEAMFDGDDEYSAEFEPDPEPTLFCKSCDFETASWFDARQHAQEMLTQFDKQAKFIKDLEEVAAEVHGYDQALIDARKAKNTGLPYRHWLFAARYVELCDKLRGGRYRP